MRFQKIEDLLQFHEDILKLKENYQPPRHLMAKVDAECKNYIESGDYYTWLALAIRLLKPERILELGNAHGTSTVMMYSEITDITKVFTSVDIIQDIVFVPDSILCDHRMVFKFGNDLNLSIYEDMLPSQIDLLFIDTLHECKQVQDEWKIYHNLCKTGALVVLDDIHFNDMGRFWDAITYPKIDITKDCHPSGFGAFIYLPDKKQQSLTKDKLITQAYRDALQVAYTRLSYQSKLSMTKRTFAIAKSLLKKK